MKCSVVNLVVQIVIICFGFVAYGQQLPTEQHLPSADEVAKCEAHLQQGKQLFKEDKEYELAIVELEQARQCAEQIGQVELLADCLHGLGKCHERLTHYEEALNFYQLALELPDDQLNPRTRAETYNKIANVYRSLAAYDLAYRYQFRALERYESIEDTSGIAKSYYDLGSIHYYQKDYQRAEVHYQNALHLAEQLDKENFLYSCYAGLGSVYEKMGKIESSLSMNVKALQIATAANNQRYIPYAQQNLGTNYLALDRNKLAEEFLLKSIDGFREGNNREGLSGSYLSLGRLQQKRQDYAAAIEALQTGLAMARAVGATYKELEILKELGVTHQLMEEYTQAYAFTSAYAKLRDSLFNQEMQQSISQQLSVRKIQEKEKEIVVLNNENELLERKQEIESLYRNIYTVSSVLLLIIALLIYNGYRRQRQSNQELQLRNEEIKEKNQQLHYFNEELKQFASVASHDLREPLRTIGSFSGLLNRRFESELPPAAKDYLQLIVSGVERMQRLLDDLLAYTRLGREEARKERVNLGEVMDAVKVNLQHVAEENEAQISYHKEALPDVLGVESQLVQLFQNLVSNAIKFKGDRTPKITIGCHEINGHEVIAVSDNGIGIEPAYQEKIFEMFGRLHTRQEYDGTGIGLATCKKIVQRHGGKIWVESTPGEGSTFYISLLKPSKEKLKVTYRAAAF